METPGQDIFAAIELDWAASNIQKAIDEDEIATAAEAAMKSAQERLDGAITDIDRFAAKLDIIAAQEIMLRLSGASSMLDAELQQIIDQANQ